MLLFPGFFVLAPRGIYRDSLLSRGGKIHSLRQPDGNLIGPF
jgi:hypothetical protein